MTKILLLENPHTIADKAFHDTSIEVQRIDGPLDEDALIEALQGCQMVRIRSKTNLSRHVFESCPDLVCAGTFTVNANQADLKVVAAHGVAMFNASYSNTRSVAGLTISEVIALTQLLPMRDAHMQRTGWQKTARNSHEVHGKTLGVIGYSSTGARLSILVEAIGMRIQFYDLAKELPIGNAEQCGSLEEALQGADFVSLRVDGRPANRSVFGAREIVMMRPGSKLLNLSQGLVVDVNILAVALGSGYLGGCVVDVFPEEPLKDSGPFESPLLGKENTVPTPHIGGSTLETQENTGSFASAETCNYIQTEEAVMSVNMPTLFLQPAERTRYCMSVIHQNTPSVIRHINQVMAAASVNVESQILGTSDEVGCVIADIASELPVAAVQDIDAMDTTIRCWVIPLPGFTRVDVTTVN